MSNEETAVEALSIMQSGAAIVTPNDSTSTQELSAIKDSDAINSHTGDEDLVDSDGSTDDESLSRRSDQSDFGDVDEADDTTGADEEANDADSQETEEEDLRRISKKSNSKDSSLTTEHLSGAESDSNNYPAQSKSTKSRRKPEYFDPELYGLRRSVSSVNLYTSDCKSANIVKNRSHTAPDRFVEVCFLGFSDILI